MKTIVRIFIYLTIIVLVTSCSTTEKFTLSAPVGTKITLPLPGNVESKSNNSEKQNITIPSEGYCGYILATSPGSSTPIPMGLDLMRNKHNGRKVSLGVSSVLLGAGSLGMIGGGIAACAASSGPGLTILGISAVAGLTGSGMYMASIYTLTQTSYDYSFGYVKNQQLDIPQLSDTLIHPNPEKDALKVVAEEKPTRKRATSGEANVNTSSQGSKVSKSRIAPANKIAGIYKGTGQLLLNKRQKEYYSNIEIEISPTDKNIVNVRIIEDGEDFFESHLTYSVTTDNRGNYKLKIDNIPDAVINITKSGVLSFTHPKVNIDDTMYSLIIKATKN